MKNEIWRARDLSARRIRGRAPLSSPDPSPGSSQLAGSEAGILSAPGSEARFSGSLLLLGWAGPRRAGRGWILFVFCFVRESDILTKMLYVSQTKKWHFPEKVNFWDLLGRGREYLFSPEESARELSWALR